MGVRYRRFYKCCKDRKGCNGRIGKDCPVNELPKRENGKLYKCGVWLVELFDENKVWQSMAFKDIRSKADAEKRLTLLIADRERGILKLPKKKIIPTLADYSKVYLEHYKNDKRNTYLLKLRMVSTLTRYLGDYTLDKITPFIVEKYRIERKEQDKVKDSSINIDIAILSHIYTVAIKTGIVDKNPCKEVKRLRVIQVKDRILSQSEIALLLDKLCGKDRLMVLVGLFTGMRLGGVLGLSWHDIDFDKRLITSAHKTGKLISIPLSGYVAEELLRYKENTSGEKVFESREIIPDIVGSYSKHFRNLFKSLGIHGFTFHNLRHTFSSLLQSNLGIGAVVVQGMTGHSSLSMLQKYSHTGMDAKQDAIQALTDHILNTGKEKVLSIAQ